MQNKPWKKDLFTTVDDYVKSESPGNYERIVRVVEFVEREAREQGKLDAQNLREEYNFGHNMGYAKGNKDGAKQALEELRGEIKKMKMTNFVGAFNEGECHAINATCEDIDTLLDTKIRELK